jgi:response regulator RpfG family c-di-GMP phosphodiesterase
MGRNILCVSHDASMARFLQDHLAQYHYQVNTHPDCVEALRELESNPRYDLVLVLATPQESETLNAFRARVEATDPRIRFLVFDNLSTEVDETGAPTITTDQIALNAYELLELIEEVFRVTTQRSAPVVLPTAEQLKECLTNAIITFTSLLEQKTFISGGNSSFISTYAVSVAAHLGLPQVNVDEIGLAALLQDIGMVRVTGDPLLSEGKVTEKTWRHIKNHPSYSINICNRMKIPWEIRDIILAHHEKYDGTGYPKGLQGREIPIGARVLSVVDSFFAMISNRPYRRALSKEEAVAELIANAGTKFDPEVVEVFVSVIKEKIFSGDAEVERPRKVALLDFDENVHSLLRLKLGKIGLQVLDIWDPNIAFAVLKQEKTDMVLLDIEFLSEMGLDFIHWLKQDEHYQKVPLVLMASEHGPNEDVVVAMEIGADDFISKPLKPKEIVGKVNAILRKAKRQVAQSYSDPFSYEGIRGRLAEMNLFEIIQVLGHGLKTALVTLRDDSHEGKVYFVHGQIRHAVFENLAGPEAFVEILKMRRGNFMIEHGISTPTRSILQSNDSLLLQSMKQMDEEDSTNNTVSIPTQDLA